MGKIVAFMNNKGGVGKTTVAMNLSAYLSMREKRVLLIDLDFQRSLTVSMGYGRNAEGVTIADILLNKKPIEEGIRKTKSKYLDMIPSSRELADFDKNFKELDIVKERINPIKNKYDYIFLDCNPGLSALSLNSLTAASRLLIPIQPDYLSIEGLTVLINEVVAPESDYKILFNMVDRRLTLTNDVIDLIRKQYKNKVFKTEIVRNIRVAEAPSFHRPIFDYDSGSTGADCFRNFGREFITW